MNQNDPHYESARQKVEDRYEFFKHLRMYAVMNLFFFLLNIITSPDGLWFMWPMLGWGIGLAIHFIRAFDPFESSYHNEAAWKERELEKELRKRRNSPRARGFVSPLPENMQESEDYLELEELDELEELIQEKDKTFKY